MMLLFTRKFINNLNALILKQTEQAKIAHNSQTIYSLFIWRKANTKQKQQQTMSTPVYPTHINTLSQSQSQSQSQQYQQQTNTGIQTAASLSAAINSLSLGPHPDLPAGAGEPEYVVPVEYKIVDLPIIAMPTMNVLKVMDCKIYRRPAPLLQGQSQSQTDGEWKRKCMGRIKFVQVQPQQTDSSGLSIVVAAYEYNSCHLRLKETPRIVQSNPRVFKLVKSQEFENNWVYRNEQNEHISIALRSASECEEFRQMWEYARILNTKQAQAQGQGQGQGQGQHQEQYEKGQEQKQQQQKEQKQNKDEYEYEQKQKQSMEMKKQSNADDAHENLFDLRDREQKQ